MLKHSLLTTPPAIPPPPPPPIVACGDLLYDQDGHSYKTMEIAGQCWMAENLNTGVMLASASAMPKPNNNIIEKWCYNNDPSICETDGGLYSWYEAMYGLDGDEAAGTQGICPPGWHIPTRNEWEAIDDLFTSDLNKFKAFFPLFPGLHSTNGTFYYRSSGQYLWSSTEAITSIAWGWYLGSSYSFFGGNSNFKEFGLSVRCLMD